MKSIFWKQRFGSYEKALYCLKETILAINKESENFLYKLATIQAFEFTSELALKLLQDYLTYQGYINFLSPRDVIRQAFQAQIIVDGQTWIEILEVRNNILCSYDDTQLSQIVNRIQNDFYPLLQQFQIEFKGFER